MTGTPGARPPGCRANTSRAQRLGALAGPARRPSVAQVVAAGRHYGLTVRCCRWVGLTLGSGLESGPAEGGINHRALPSEPYRRGTTEQQMEYYGRAWVVAAAAGR